VGSIPDCVKPKTTPFWYAVFRIFRRYAVRKALVRMQYAKIPSYADNKFYFKKVEFLSRNTINEAKKKIFFRALALMFDILSLTLIWGMERLKHIKKKNVYNNDCACACHRLYFYVNENAKMVVFWLKGTQYAEIRPYAVRKLKMKQYAVRKWGRITLIIVVPDLYFLA